MFTSKLAAIYAVALACAAAVQGATLVERTCVPDTPPPICETSGGSPEVYDCSIALKYLNGNARQSNSRGSHCQTVSKFGTCKIDACGDYGGYVVDGVSPGRWLQQIIDGCQSGGRVGGRIEPKKCIAFENVGTEAYTLQFSHS
ncbi:hypothetical protein C8Q80DRAFT_1274044 [Daedaleopsis nitida]|nr:hypothetical protein C8Q80DRAFT_1274044 [Daedaleopsis nitida]